MNRIILIFVILLCLNQVSYAQKNYEDISELISDLDQHHAQFPKEYIYTHVDRSYYSPGDDVWFKSYLTLGNFNSLSNLSKLIYVDLIDPNDEIIQSNRLPSIEGLAIGDFSLPTTISNGTYRIRAYTNWMRNFDQANFFEREIRILSSSASALNSKEEANKRDVFEKDNISAKPTDIDINDYRLVVNNLVDKSLIIELHIGSNKVNGQELHFLIQQEGEVFAAYKLIADKPIILFKTPRNTMADGVNELILFSKDMQPLLQQKIFSFPISRRLPIRVTPDKERYSTREKVKVSVLVGNESDSLKVGSFSVSVTYQGKVPEGKERNNHIISSLLLENNLTSHIFNEYDLTSEDVADKMKLDSLLLKSQKNEAWNLIPSKGVEFPVENGLQISGLIQKLNGKHEPNAVVTLVSPGGGIFLNTLSDASGRFQFSSLLFNDSTQFIVQAITEKGDRDLKIVIDTLESPVIRSREHLTTYRTSLDDKDKAYIHDNRERADSLTLSLLATRTTLLDEAKVQWRSNENKVKRSSNLNGPGKADQVLVAEDLGNCFSLADCLNGQLLGVIFKNGVPYSARSYADGKIKLIVDGMEMRPEDLSLVDPSNVETIEVLISLSNLALYGVLDRTERIEGILIITTKRWGSGNAYEEDAPGVKAITPKGFSIARAFVSPDYSSKEQEVEGKDIRATIYWNANIITDEKGESFFEFYTSDEPGKYRVIIEGIDLDGRLGYTSMELEVN